jgi:hypothetical protein
VGAFLSTPEQILLQFIKRAHSGAGAAHRLRHAAGQFTFGEIIMQQHMAENQIQNVAQDFINALRSLEEGEGDTNAEPLAMLFNGDAVLTNAALQHGDNGISGRDSILQFWVRYKQELGEARTTFHHVTTSANAAGLFWTTEGTGPNGEALRYHGASLLEFDEMSLIKFFRGYYDTRELIVKAQGAASG